MSDSFLENIGILSQAYDLEHATLYVTEGSWKTIHPRWDIELLLFLYNESKRSRLLGNKQHLKTALDLVFNIKEDKITATQERAYAMIGTIYDIAGRGVIPIDLAESVIQIPSYFTNKQKSWSWYNKDLSLANLHKYDESIKCYDKSIEKNPNHLHARYAKGIVFHRLGKYNEAIRFSDKAIEISLCFRRI